jgi:hypothetical protein
MTTQSLLEFVHPALSSSRRDICVAALYFLETVRSTTAWSPPDLKSELVSARIPKAKSFNVSDVLGKAGPVVRVSGSAANGAKLWSLTDSGRTHAEQILGLAIDPLMAEVTNDVAVLKSLCSTLKDEVVHGYVEEAILAYGVGALRASVVFLWSGAIRQLQEKAVGSNGSAINPALQKHDPKARNVGKIEDFAAVKDSVQLLAFREIGLIDKGQWSTLEEGLNLRNRCGHPTKYRPGVKKVSAFVEDILGIVFV